MSRHGFLNHALAIPPDAEALKDCAGILSRSNRFAGPRQYPYLARERPHGEHRAYALCLDPVEYSQGFRSVARQRSVCQFENIESTAIGDA
jgi:hypothetical protein